MSLHLVSCLPIVTSVKICGVQRPFYFPHTGSVLVPKLRPWREDLLPSHLSSKTLIGLEALPAFARVSIGVVSYLVPQLGVSALSGNL